MRHSPNTAMGSDRVGRRITPWLKRSSISRKERIDDVETGEKSLTRDKSGGMA
jgi:hypothetical protein